VPAVRDAWGLADDVTPPGFASIVYGAKFNFMSGSPGMSAIYSSYWETLSPRLPQWFSVLRRDRDGHLIVC
jgi:hypothetical protein